jgi:ribosomal protein L20A (L18A)
LRLLGKEKRRVKEKSNTKVFIQEIDEVDEMDVEDPKTIRHHDWNYNSSKYELR